MHKTQLDNLNSLQRKKNFHSYSIWCEPNMFDPLVMFVCVGLNIISTLWCAPNQRFMSPTLVWFLWYESNQSKLEEI